MRHAVLALVAVTFVGCGGPANHNQTGTKKLFYMVSPNFNREPDLPSSVGNSPEDFFNAIKAEDGKAYFLATFTLTGAEGYFLTTAIVYTKDGDGMKGWNIVDDKSRKTREQKYFSVSNGVRADIVLNGVLYLVATEVPLEATKEDIKTTDLERLLQPSFDYLNSLL